MFSGITRTRILIVENDAVTALDLEGLLTEADYLLTGIAGSANEAFELARRSPPDLVLLDIGLVGSVDGIELARRLQDGVSLAHVYVTGHMEPDVLVRANRTGPLGFVVKPFCDAELLTGIEIALCRSRQQCRAASDSGAAAPFVVDRHFPLLQAMQTSGRACRMERQCSSHRAAAIGTDVQPLAAPEAVGAVGTSWRPE